MRKLLFTIAIVMCIAFASFFGFLDWMYGNHFFQVVIFSGIAIILLSIKIYYDVRQPES
jgi:cellulose synthase/poly-beta-1,6-N-acetylglucosamine synthase-like glycosyltransferase